jgi:TetR/AcrR family tetracycline transcriptional repressor
MLIMIPPEGELYAVQLNWTWYSSQVARTPGQRAGLTTPAVLGAARELLAEQGLAGLTMRAIARRLDVAPNALYSHVRDKTELVDTLLDDVLAGVAEPPAATADPAAGLTTVMTSTYRTLLQHRDLVPLYLARQGARGPRAAQLGATMDTLLARAGVPDVEIGRARRALIVHTIGWAAIAAGGDGPVPPAESDEGFAAALRWLLAGIFGG